MCTFFGVSRAAYYAWVKAAEEPDKDAERMALVQDAWMKSRKTYGYRRVTIHLQQKGHKINHKTVLRLMNKLSIRSVVRTNRYKRKSQDVYHRYDNVLKRDFSAIAPNQKWVTDISYIPTQQGWVCLSTIKDLFDGYIVSHQLGKKNSIELVKNTIRQAMHKEKVTDGLLLHSDQGHQYTSHPYFVLTTEYHIKPSMSRRGNCWDNAPMENFFGHFKEEALRQYPTPTFQEAKEIVDGYIAFYNYERIQLKTRQTPYQTRCLSR